MTAVRNLYLALRLIAVTKKPLSLDILNLVGL
jgi:hypothetical protein